MAQVVPWRTVRLACWYRRVRVPTRRSPRRVGGTAMAQVAPWWTVCPSCWYRRVRVPTRRSPRRVGGTAMAQVAPWWTVCPSCWYRRVRVPTRRPPSSPEWYGKLDGQQVPEHDTKRATQPIFVNLARASECQDRRKTAPSAALKKPRRFPSLAARFFTICLNSKKSRRS